MNLTIPKHKQYIYIFSGFFGEDYITRMQQSCHALIEIL